MTSTSTSTQSQHRAFRLHRRGGITFWRVGPFCGTCSRSRATTPTQASQTWIIRRNGSLRRVALPPEAAWQATTDALTIAAAGLTTLAVVLAALV